MDVVSGCTGPSDVESRRCAGSGWPGSGVTYFRCEYKVDPMGIDVRQPRLSWQLVASERGVVQSAYQIRVAERAEGLASNPIWDTGRVASAWEFAEGQFRLDVTVPPNTHATVRLPHATLAGVTESGQALDAADGITNAVQDGEAVVVEVGSGSYRFVYDAGGG